VGHVARLLETAGISTVIIAAQAFRKRMEMMTLPRVLLTPHLMGRPLGPPCRRDVQRKVLLAALRLLEQAQGPGTIEEMTAVV
jgi:hypothetical protein